MKAKKIIPAVLFFGLLVFIDQSAKRIIRSKGGFYICNSDISWGIQIPQYLFVIFWLLVIAFLIILWIKKRSKINAIFILLIFSGAVSNILDRVVFGCVIDFIKISIFPIFNPADIFITAGTILLLAKSAKL
jgi:lipoprotein signal peptidase